MKLLPAGPAHEREGMAAAGFLLAVALGLAAAPSPAGAGTVVVLRSRALGVYDSLAAGFRASYRGSVADLVLGEADDPALGSRIAALHPDVVVAVGLRAALFTRDQYKMLQEDNTGDNGPLLEVFLNARLTPLREGLASYLGKR